MKQGTLGPMVDDRKFEVVIYEKDYKELCAWVLRKPHIETGGDLFGLWADEHSAVIGVTLGPGKGCKRTSVSFYQDVKYLEKVGSYLTQNEGVCHIGEWHSHHQLGLARPSGGDENTVWNNMPTYKLSRFVIFIANIEASRQSYKVNIGCFLFEIDSKGNQLPVLQGKFKILHSENPFSWKNKASAKRNVYEGEEEKRGDEFNIVIEDLELEEGENRPYVIVKRPVRNTKRNYPPDSDKNDRQQPCKMNKPQNSVAHGRKNTGSGGRSETATQMKLSDHENRDESEGLSTEAHPQPSVPEDSFTPQDKTPMGVTTGASVTVEGDGRGERKEDKEAKDKEEKEKKLGEEEEEKLQPNLEEKKKNEGGNTGDQRKEAKDVPKEKSKKKAASVEESVNKEGKANRKVPERAASKSITRPGQQGKDALAKTGKPKVKKLAGAGTSPGTAAGKMTDKSVKNPPSGGRGDLKKRKEETKSQTTAKTSNYKKVTHL